MQPIVGSSNSQHHSLNYMGVVNFIEREVGRITTRILGVANILQSIPYIEQLLRSIHQKK
jgi:hypothetical protein